MRQSSPIMNIMSNPRSASREKRRDEAALHLRELGDSAFMLRIVAVFCDECNRFAGKDRANAFEEKLSSRGIPLLTDIIVYTYRKS